MNSPDPTRFSVWRADIARGDIVLDTRNPGDVITWVTDDALFVRGAHALKSDGSTEFRTRETADGCVCGFCHV